MRRCLLQGYDNVGRAAGTPHSPVMGTTETTATLPSPSLALLHPRSFCCYSFAPLAAMSSAWADIRGRLAALLRHTSLAAPGLAQALKQFQIFVSGLDLQAIEPTAAERAEVTR